MPRNSLIAAAALAALASQPVFAQQEPEADRARVTFTASTRDTQERAQASAHKLEWHALSLPNGAVRLLLRVPLESLQSGAPGFDASLRETFDASRHPYLELEGLVRPGDDAAAWTGWLRYAGQTRAVRASLSLSRAGSQLSLHAALPLDLDGMALPRPRLGGEPVENELQLELSAQLTLDPQALVSGGFISPARE